MKFISVRKIFSVFRLIDKPLNNGNNGNNNYSIQCGSQELAIWDKPERLLPESERFWVSSVVDVVISSSFTKAKRTLK